MMKTIPEEVYKDLAEQLKAAVNEEGFYNGRLFYEDGEYYYQLTCTVIAGFIPVWYECVAGTELTNDFTWDKFKEYLV